MATHALEVVGREWKQEEKANKWLKKEPIQPTTPQDQTRGVFITNPQKLAVGALSARGPVRPPTRAGQTALPPTVGKQRLELKNALEHFTPDTLAFYPGDSGCTKQPRRLRS